MGILKGFLGRCLGVPLGNEEDARNGCKTSCRRGAASAGSGPNAQRHGDDRWYQTTAEEASEANTPQLALSGFDGLYNALNDGAEPIVLLEFAGFSVTSGIRKGEEFELPDHLVLDVNLRNLLDGPCESSDTHIRQLRASYAHCDAVRISALYANSPLRSLLHCPSPQQYELLLSQLLASDQLLSTALKDTCILLLEGAGAAAVHPSGPSANEYPLIVYHPAHGGSAPVILSLTIHPLLLCRRRHCYSNGGNLQHQFVAAVALRYRVSTGADGGGCGGGVLHAQLHRCLSALAGLTSSVTLLSGDGRQVLYQNTASICYMGLRQGFTATATLETLEMASGSDADGGGVSSRGDGWLSGCTGVLSELFLLNPQLLEGALQELSVRRTWKGVVRVPYVLTRRAPLPPPVSQYQEGMEHENTAEGRDREGGVCGGHGSPRGGPPAAVMVLDFAGSWEQLNLLAVPGTEGRPGATLAAIPHLHSSPQPPTVFVTVNGFNNLSNSPSRSGSSVLRRGASSPLVHTPSRSVRKPQVPGPRDSTTNNTATNSNALTNNKSKNNMNITSPTTSGANLINIPPSPNGTPTNPNPNQNQNNDNDDYSYPQSPLGIKAGGDADTSFARNPEPISPVTTSIAEEAGTSATDKPFPASVQRCPSRHLLRGHSELRRTMPSVPESLTVPGSCPPPLLPLLSLLTHDLSQASTPEAAMPVVSDSGALPAAGDSNLAGAAITTTPNGSVTTSIITNNRGINPRGIVGTDAWGTRGNRGQPAITSNGDAGLGKGDSNPGNISQMALQSCPDAPTIDTTVAAAEVLSSGPRARLMHRSVDGLSTMQALTQPARHNSGGGGGSGGPGTPVPAPSPTFSGAISDVYGSRSELNCKCSLEILCSGGTVKDPDLIRRMRASLGAAGEATTPAASAGVEAVGDGGGSGFGVSAVASRGLSASKRQSVELRRSALGRLMASPILGDGNPLSTSTWALLAESGGGVRNTLRRHTSFGAAVMRASQHSMTQPHPPTLSRHHPSQSNLQANQSHDSTATATATAGAAAALQRTSRSATGMRSPPQAINDAVLASMRARALAQEFASSRIGGVVANGPGVGAHAGDDSVNGGGEVPMLWQPSFASRVPSIVSALRQSPCGSPFTSAAGISAAERRSSRQTEVYGKVGNSGFRNSVEWSGADANQSTTAKTGQASAARITGDAGAAAAPERVTPSALLRQPFRDSMSGRAAFLTSGARHSRQGETSATPAPDYGGEMTASCVSGELAAVLGLPYGSRPAGDDSSSRFARCPPRSGGGGGGGDGGLAALAAATLGSPSSARSLAEAASPSMVGGGQQAGGGGGSGGVSSVEPRRPPSTALISNRRLARMPLGSLSAAPMGGDEGGEGEGEEACWHEVTLSLLDGQPGGSGSGSSGSPMLILMQTDVTARVQAERSIAKVLEAEHCLLESIFPRHVLDLAAATACKNSSRQGGAAQYRLAQLPLAQESASIATYHPMVTILFADIRGFTNLCHAIPATQVMQFLNHLYSRLDTLLDVYGVYKVETIGDCYMVAGGLMTRDADGFMTVREPDSVDDLHAAKAMAFAKAMLREASKVLLPTTGQPVEMRIGLHSGPVMSGIVGSKMPRFCLFGDTVNTASRMESTCPPGCIHVSAATRACLPDEDWEPSGGVQVKGIGVMSTFRWHDGSDGRSSGEAGGGAAGRGGGGGPRAARARRASTVVVISSHQAQAMSPLGGGSSGGTTGPGGGAGGASNPVSGSEAVNTTGCGGGGDGSGGGVSGSNDAAAGWLDGIRPSRGEAGGGSARRRGARLKVKRSCTFLVPQGGGVGEGGLGRGAGAGPSDATLLRREVSALSVQKRPGARTALAEGAGGAG